MPEDVLSKDAKLSEGDEADSELNTQAGEQPSPYDRWRNYQPPSLARSESVDPLDLLSEPVTPIATSSDSAPAAPAERHEDANIFGGANSSQVNTPQSATPESKNPESENPETGTPETRTPEGDHPVAHPGSSYRAERTERIPSAVDGIGANSEPAPPAIEEPRRSPFVADDEMRAVYTGALKSAAGDGNAAHNRTAALDTVASVNPKAGEPHVTYVPSPASNVFVAAASASHFLVNPVPAALKSQALTTENLNPDVLSTDWVNKDGIDVAPSRKLDTPDMLRWRAEMLLDEMMVGAVDSSAGEGASTRRSMPFDEAAMLDDHPRREIRPENPAPTAGTGAEHPIAPTNSYGAQNRDVPTVDPELVVSAGVRAALPPRTVTRMPTPIVRDAAGADASAVNGNSATVGLAANNGSANGYSANGNGNNGNGHGNGANGHTGYTLEPSEYEIADDGRPTTGAIDSSGLSSSDAAEPTSFVLASQQGGDAPVSASPNSAPSADPLDHLGTYAPNAYSSALSAAMSASTVETQQRTPARTPTGTPARTPTRTTGAPASAASATPVPANPAPARAPSPLSPPAPAPLSSPSGDRYASTSNRGETEQTTRKLTAVEKRYPRPVSTDGQGQQSSHSSTADFAASGAHNDTFDLSREAYTSGLGPVRINPAVINSASITGAMSVGSRVGSRYASLLPRATPWDLHEMEREIVSLQEEMARVLPSGHETSRRAHHLLEKAQSIFNGDPLRSAEVDYYLTQVRAIVQRSRQTMQWSELYRHQLGRYHLAWIVLSSLMIVLGLVFGDQLASWVVALFGLNPNGMIGAYAVPAVIAMFAGSLGASIGAILNIRRYHRLSLGYFDRKYSLRGLMLPIIGLLGGVVFFGLFGSIYWAMGTESPLPVGLELLPAILAFALGFLQESIYGTRD